MTGPPASWDVILGALEAFLVAFIIVGFDCHNNVTATLRVATVPIYRLPIAYVVWTLCGIAAVVAFLLSVNASTDNWVNQALSLGTTNNYARGLAVGASVLVLIRSKLITAGGSDIGGEYFYNLGRVAILRSVTRRRARERNDFLRDALQPMMVIPDFEEQLVGFVNTYMEGDSEALRKSLTEQFRQVQTGKPPADFNPASVDWQRYYRNLAGVAVDYCGVSEISKWVRTNSR